MSALTGLKWCIALSQETDEGGHGRRSGQEDDEEQEEEEEEEDETVRLMIEAEREKQRMLAEKEAARRRAKEERKRQRTEEHRRMQEQGSKEQDEQRRWGRWCAHTTHRSCSPWCLPATCDPGLRAPYAMLVSRHTDSNSGWRSSYTCSVSSSLKRSCKKVVRWGWGGAGRLEPA